MATPLGQVVGRLRQQRGWTQVDLANRAGEALAVAGTIGLIGLIGFVAFAVAAMLGGDEPEKPEPS